MSNMNDIDAGKLIAVVEQLSKTVDKLDSRIQELENQLTKGKGMLVGVFITASGVGAAATTAISKWIT